jgi:predicted AAA+ superfamily ATPase
MNNVTKLIARAEALLERLEQWIPAPAAKKINWKKDIAFRWRKRGAYGYLQPVTHPHQIDLDDLLGIDNQKKTIVENTEQFLSGCPANNVLLTGARGTGKSSLIKALLNQYQGKGLRVIEVDKHDLVDLPDIVELIEKRDERFILFCDDLSFNSDEPGYKALKVILDGSVAAASENVLIYATSNRRHLMPEFMQENFETKYIGEEIHPGEAVEEKIALSERFGIWLSFYPFTQEEYLLAVDHWLKKLGAFKNQSTHQQAALQWSLSRGSRSGRVAWQFARDWAGKQQLSKKK